MSWAVEYHTCIDPRNRWAIQVHLPKEVSASPGGLFQGTGTTPIKNSLLFLTWNCLASTNNFQFCLLCEVWWVKKLHWVDKWLYITQIFPTQQSGLWDSKFCYCSAKGYIHAFIRLQLLTSVGTPQILHWRINPQFSLSAVPEANTSVCDYRLCVIRLIFDGMIFCMLSKLTWALTIVKLTVSVIGKTTMKQGKRGDFSEEM